MAKYEYDTGSRRYRDTGNGRYLSASDVATLRDQFILMRTTKTSRLVAEIFGRTNARPFVNTLLIAAGRLSRQLRHLGVSENHAAHAD